MYHLHKDVKALVTNKNFKFPTNYICIFLVYVNSWIYHKFKNNFFIQVLYKTFTQQFHSFHICCTMILKQFGSLDDITPFIILRSMHIYCNLPLKKSWECYQTLSSIKICAGLKLISSGLHWTMKHLARISKLWAFKNLFRQIPQLII